MLPNLTLNRWCPIRSQRFVTSVPIGHGCLASAHTQHTAWSVVPHSRSATGWLHFPQLPFAFPVPCVNDSDLRAHQVRMGLSQGFRLLNPCCIPSAKARMHGQSSPRSKRSQKKGCRANHSRSRIKGGYQSTMPAGPRAHGTPFGKPRSQGLWRKKPQPRQTGGGDSRFDSLPVWRITKIAKPSNPFAIANGSPAPPLFQLNVMECEAII